jgi:tryptophan synthase alpha chain
VVVRRTSGFVYYVSVAGVTGVKEADAAPWRPHVERVRKASGLPVAVGFGIRTPERPRRSPGRRRAWWWVRACGRSAEAVEMNEDVTVEFFQSGSLG